MQPRLAENVVHFVRVLRDCGLPVGPAKALDALAAVSAVGIADRGDFRAALAAVLVSRHEHLAVFDQAFDLYWRNPRLGEKMMAALLPKVEGKVAADKGNRIAARIAQALQPPRATRQKRGAGEITYDAAFTFSPREVLHTRDFASMTVDELDEARRMIARLRLPLPAFRVRRMRPATRGTRVDLRTSVRRMTGAAGTSAPLAFRRAQRRAPPLVVLCDISGSMDRYARMLLHFLHAITNDRHRVHVLLFGTRLTSVTRHLKHRDVDVALDRVAEAVPDWAGGTRIGACLREFNQRWARRLLAQNAVVLLITDGLDADAAEGLAFEADRLHRSCRRLVWLNPLLRYAGFEARPAGVRALLPHVDDFRPVHSLASLESLAHALSSDVPRRRTSRKPVNRDALRPDASAEPRASRVPK
ncbi:MAG TPA: VWA domain-containing protein [Casimicrobiaceae bacterium]|nr:VWA domain-containing protein [Casimicrobiaceae bacterium]